MSKQHCGAVASQSSGTVHARGEQPADPHDAEPMPQHCDGAVQVAGPSHVAVTPAQVAVTAMQRGAFTRSAQHLVPAPQTPPEPHATPTAWPPLQKPATQDSPPGQPCVASHLNLTPSVGSPYEHATSSNSHSAFTPRR